MAGTTDWIAAAEALKIAEDRLGADGPAGALIAAAEAGAIKARAQRFTVELPNACGQKAVLDDELVEIPPEFWSSQGRALVEQDWESGVFASLVNASFQHQAFGVEFDRAAIEALVQSSK